MIDQKFMEQLLKDLITLANKLNAEVCGVSRAQTSSWEAQMS
jgi:hypothetical protein